MMEEPLELIEVQELWRHVGFIRHHHCLYVNDESTRCCR